MRLIYNFTLLFHLLIMVNGCKELTDSTKIGNQTLSDTLDISFDTSKIPVTSRAIDSFVATIFNYRKGKTFRGMQITIWEPVDTKLIFIDFSNQIPIFNITNFRFIDNTSQSKIVVENNISIKKPKSGWKKFSDSLFSIQLPELNEDFPFYKFGQLTHGTWVDIEKRERGDISFSRVMSPSFYKNVIFSCYQVSNLLDYLEDESGIVFDEKSYITASDPAYYGVDSLYNVKFSEIFIDSSIGLNQNCSVISEYPEKILLNSGVNLTIENRMKNSIEFYVAVDKSNGKQWYSSFLSVEGNYPFDSNLFGELLPGQKVSKRLFEPGGRWENRASQYFDMFITHARFVVFFREKGKLKFEHCRTKAIPVVQCDN